MLPTCHAQVFTTEAGTPYLREPGVALISMPHVDLEGLRGYLEGFDPDLAFEEYLNDPVELPPAERLCKFAGQQCYASFEQGKHTTNDKAQEYFDNIKRQGHGSVFMHAFLSFHFYGMSRTASHELVRHMAGTAYSQLSQRYVDGKVLRFVERPEYVGDEFLHTKFEARIDAAAEEYDILARHMQANELKRQESLPDGQRQSKREIRIRVNQAARSSLPGETETALVFTGNLRAVRHMLEMRGSKFAEPEIRRLVVKVEEICQEVCPMIFSDHDIELIDGEEFIKSAHPKV